jgi:processive 1,2-diacylglycerol beta-glucosyltransferase
MSLRVLILSASVGSGHNRAAEAIDLAMRERLPSAEIERVDVLDFAKPLFRRCYSRGYFDLIAKAPHLVGYLYDRLDQPLKAWERPFDNARFGIQNLSLRRLIRKLTSDTWDIAICTHFLPAEIVAAMRRGGRMHCPLAIVTTDFDTHRLWHSRPCELFFTATAEGKANLTRWGVPPDQICVSGIPVHPTFSQRRGKIAARRELGLDPHRPVLLQLSGGVGVGPIEQIHQELLSVTTPAQIVAVTGHNHRVLQTLEAIDCPLHHDRRIIGFTKQIDIFMAAADLVVSKPGGLTVSESLCRGLPMMIIDPIPGQETRNSDFLLENGAGVKVNGLAAIKLKIEQLLSDVDRLERMSDTALRLGRPGAAHAVVDRCLSLVRPKRPTRPPEMEAPARAFRREQAAYL